MALGFGCFGRLLRGLQAWEVFCLCLSSELLFKDTVYIACVHVFLKCTILALTAEMFSIDIMHRDPATIQRPQAISISCALYNNIPSPLVLFLLLLLSRPQENSDYPESTIVAS